MSRTRTHAYVLPLSLLLAVVLGLAGCGSDEQEAGKKPDEKSSSTTADEATGPKADADGMVQVSKAGVRLKVPATWELKKDTEGGELFIWRNPASKDSGLVALSVQNSTQTAEEWIALLVGPQGILHGRVTKRGTAEVEGLGTGRRLQTEAKGRRTDRLVVATMDGLLVEVSYYSDPDPEHSGYADLILSSVSRDL